MMPVRMMRLVLLLLAGGDLPGKIPRKEWTLKK
jgi:hypothetical protein